MCFPISFEKYPAVQMEVKSVLWYRHGLRLHDNPALLEAIRRHGNQEVTFYPVFIFDGESAGNSINHFIQSKIITNVLLRIKFHTFNQILMY